MDDLSTEIQIACFKGCDVLTLFQQHLQQAIYRAVAIDAWISSELQKLLEREPKPYECYGLTLERLLFNKPVITSAQWIKDKIARKYPIR